MKKGLVTAVLMLVFCLPATMRGVYGAERQDDGPLTPLILQKKLDDIVSEQDNQLLAQRIRNWIGEDALSKGPVTRVDGLTVAWILNAPGAKRPPRVVSEDGKFTQRLTHINGTDLFAAAITRPEGEALRFNFEVDGQKVGSGSYEVYTVLPDSLPKQDVPKGTVTQMPKWKSRIFAETERDWWVYVPAQYRADKPACVMIFQDGSAYVGFGPTVFDNLIAKGDMPVTAAVFINPGSFADNRRPPAAERSYEYDSLSPQYAKFLLEEILPEVEKTTKLRHDAESRAVAGLSSGGICAFTVAWERPDQFSKVLSWIGSFTGIASGKTLKEGGNNYPVMIRKTKPSKPIRVFLQDGDSDLDNENGNWPLANQEMAKALAFAHYDSQFVFGHGAHSMTHGRAILPDSLRWLWRTTP